MAPFVHVHIGLLAHDVGKPAADTLNGGESEHDLLLSIDVGVQDTQNVLEVFVRDQRLQIKGNHDKIRTGCINDLQIELSGSRKKE